MKKELNFEKKKNFLGGVGGSVGGVGLGGGSWWM